MLQDLPCFSVFWWLKIGAKILRGSARVLHWSVFYVEEVDMTLNFSAELRWCEYFDIATKREDFGYEFGINAHGEGYGDGGVVA